MTTVLLLFQADREFFQFATLNRSIIVCFGIDICGTEIVHLSLYCLGSGSHHSTGIPQITVCNAYFLPGRLIQADSCPAASAIIKIAVLYCQYLRANQAHDTSTFFVATVYKGTMSDSNIRACRTFIASATININS